MPGFSNLITKYSYSYPEITWCEHCRWEVCVQVPCTRQVTVEKGIYAGFKFPVVTPEEEAVIISCAATATAAAYLTIIAAISGGPVVVAGAIPGANEIIKISFTECVDHSDNLSRESRDRIISDTDIGIYQRDENYIVGHWALFTQDGTPQFVLS